MWHASRRKRTHCVRRAIERVWRKGASAAFKVAGATFSDILMSRTDLVDGPVRACRTFSRGARPQIAAAYPPPATPELAQASKMIVLTHLSDCARRSSEAVRCIRSSNIMPSTVSSWL